MTLDEKVIKANKLDTEIEDLEKQIKELQEKINTLKPERDSLYLEVLAEAKEKKIKDQKVADLFVTYFSKDEITWLDDVGLLAALRANNDTAYIKVTTKTTTSVDKTALKKAFKTNESLKETYKPFCGNKLTEYVTITTDENHTKMLEHMFGEKGE